MKIKSQHAQIALEYLFVLGIVLLAVFFIVGKSVYERASGESRIITAQRTVDILSQTADDVYKLGQGNQKCAKVEIPKGVVGSSIAYGDFLLRLESGGQMTDVVGRADVQQWTYGVIPVQPGVYKLCIEQHGDQGSNLHLEGATCSAGDGCDVMCVTDDPDCTDYNNYVPSSSNPYCGNGVLEGDEECELSYACPNFEYCNLADCYCYNYTWWDPDYREPGGEIPPDGDPRDPPRDGGGASSPAGENPGDDGPQGPVTGAGGPPNDPLYWKNGTKNGSYCEGTMLPAGIGDPNQYCSATDDCPPNKVCKASGSSCKCVSTSITTAGNGVWDDGEYCDASAGNPTAQCRYSLGDVTNTQYMCNAGTCQQLAPGSTYLGDGIVQTPNMQGIMEQCDPPFDYDPQSGMVCNLLGQLVVDVDGDGLSSIEETNNVYRHGKTDPIKADTDGDTISDGAEILAGFYPNAHNDIDSVGIVSNNGILNNPAYPNVYVEQCDRSSQQYNNNYCQQEFSLTKCSDINSHCVNMDAPQ